MNTLAALDGRPLAATFYEPEQAPIGTVAILPAFAVPARFYRHLAQHLAEAGYRVLSFDPRGIGASLTGRLRDEPATLTDWVQLDYRAALHWLRDQPRPHFGVGHSLGGQLVGLLDEVSELDGLYAVAPQLAYWRRWPVPQRYGMLTAFRVVAPTLTRTFGYLPAWSGMGEAVPRGALEEWATWLLSPGYFLDHVEGSAARMSRVQAPVSIVGFTDDDYAPASGVQAIAACLPATRTEVRIVPPAHFGLDAIGHFGAFRPARTPGDPSTHPVWQDVLQRFQGWSSPTQAAAR